MISIKPLLTSFRQLCNWGTPEEIYTAEVELKESNVMVKYNPAHSDCLLKLFDYLEECGIARQEEGQFIAAMPKLFALWLYYVDDHIKLFKC
jgi:hypothetical protein